MRKIAFVALFLIILGNFTPVFASSLIISIGTTVSYWYPLPTSNYLGQVFFINRSAFIDYGHFGGYWAYDGTPTNIIEGGLWDINGTLITTSTVTVSRTGGIGFDLQVDEFIPAGFYYFGLKNISASPGSIGISKGTVGGGDYDGGCVGSYSGTGYIGTCSGDDIYFQLYGDLGNLIYINFPENSTSTPDFATWYVGYGTIATSTNLSKQVWYSTSSSFNSYYIDTEPIISGQDVENETILKLNNLNIGVWYAKSLITYDTLISTTTPPYLPTIENHILTSSTPITFNIIQGEKINNFSVFTPVNPANISSTEWGLACDDYGFLSGSFCNMLNFVFMPSEASLSKITSIGELVSEKAPLGYFTEIKEALYSGFSTTSEALDFSAIEPLADEGGIFYYIRGLLSWLVWVVFGFWVFHKFRHITL